MSSPFSDRDGPANHERPAAKSHIPEASAEASGGLDEILAETSETVLSSAPLSAAERQTLNEVVSRLRGQVVPLETVARELMLALFKHNLTALPDAESLARAMAERVARTMLDDPTTRLRIQTLWEQLLRGPA